MRNYISFLFSIFVIFSSSPSIYAQDKDNSKGKTYTEKEFLDAVEKEVQTRLNRYKPQNLVELSQEFMKKERSLELKELELKKAKEALKASENDLQKKISTFNGRSQKLLGCLDEQDKNQRKRVDHMVQVVSGMRPQSAAEVLSVQDVEIAVKILGALDPAKVSKIFNSMDKEISARLQKQFMSMKK